MVCAVNQVAPTLSVPATPVNRVQSANGPPICQIGTERSTQKSTHTGVHIAVATAHTGSYSMASIPIFILSWPGFGPPQVVIGGQFWPAAIALDGFRRDNAAAVSPGTSSGGKVTVPHFRMATAWLLYAVSQAILVGPDCFVLGAHVIVRGIMGAALRRECGERKRSCSPQFGIWTPVVKIQVT